MSLDASTRQTADHCTDPIAGTPVLLLALEFNHILALLAVIAHIAGVITSRWLFFAQAEHVVGLYYGKR